MFIVYLIVIDKLLHFFLEFHSGNPPPTWFSFRVKAAPQFLLSWQQHMVASHLKFSGQSFRVAGIW